MQQNGNNSNEETTIVKPQKTKDGEVIVQIQRGTKQEIRKEHTAPGWMLKEE